MAWQARHREARLERASRGGASNGPDWQRKVWSVGAGRDVSGIGRDGQLGTGGTRLGITGRNMGRDLPGSRGASCPRLDRTGEASTGKAVEARPEADCKVWRAKARHAGTWLDAVTLGLDWRRGARQARLDQAGTGLVRPGTTRPEGTWIGMAGSTGPNAFSQGMAWHGRRGRTGTGLARMDETGNGRARQACPDMARLGAARQVRAGRASARTGVAWQA